MAVQGSKTLQTSVRNVLAIINEIQTRMRFPLSSTVNEPHARLLLSMINMVQRDFMMEGTLWRELKVTGSVELPEGASTKLLTVQDREIDVVTHLQIPGFMPIPIFKDDDFIGTKDFYQTAGRPLIARQLSRQVGSLVLEFRPRPDKVYTLEYELQVKPPILVAETDVPALDIDTVLSGTHMLATMDSGLSYEDKLAAFQNKYSRQEQVQGGTGWGDIEI